MREIHYSIKLTEEEKAKYQEFAKERNVPLSILMREAIESAISNPSMLNPTKDDYDLDKALALWKTYDDKQKEEFQTVQTELKTLQTKMNIMEKKFDLMLKQLKVPKKAIQEAEGKDISGEAVFED